MIQFKYSEVKGDIFSLRVISFPSGNLLKTQSCSDLDQLHLMRLFEVAAWKAQ